VLNGANHVIPPKGGAIHLNPELAELRNTNISEFRRRCGDGYVSALYPGANLYLLLHFHDFDQKTRLELDSTFKAQGSVGDLFRGSASSDVQTTIAHAKIGKQLDLEFRQDGGEIETNPIDLPTAQKTVADLPAAARRGPQNLYIDITPYTNLPDVKPASLFTVLDDRQKAIRYFERLVSVFYEIIAIQRDYYRDRRTAGTKDAYFYWYRHSLRPEDVDRLRMQVMDELRLTSSIVRDFDGPSCGADSNSKSLSGNIKPDYRVFGA
jgi:hypothetical protein